MVTIKTFLNLHWTMISVPYKILKRDLTTRLGVGVYKDSIRICSWYKYVWYEDLGIPSMIKRICQKFYRPKRSVSCRKSRHGVIKSPQRTDVPVRKYETKSLCKQCISRWWGLVKSGVKPPKRPKYTWVDPGNMSHYELVNRDEVSHGSRGTFFKWCSINS